MRRRHPFELSYLSTAQWAEMPFSALKFDIKKSWLSPLIDQVRAELKAKGIQNFFHVWVSDEWFSPDGCPGIAVPYYLFHPSLIRLQKNCGLEVEGTTKKMALKLIRHEVGHAIENAWRLRRKKERQELFGTSGTPYPLSYSPIQNSSDYVVHLEGHYAQAHPDEDWAETFALWLAQSPQSWRKRYAGTKALEKLEYCQQMMSLIAHTKAPNRERFVVSPIEDKAGTIGGFMKSQNKSRIKTYSRIISERFPSQALPTPATFISMQRWYEQSGQGFLM